MALVELSDRATIAAFFRGNPRAHVYEIGDLDDFDWPHTRWFAWEHDGRLQQVALLYSEPTVPVLIAIAEAPDASMVWLLEELLPTLPDFPLRPRLAAVPPPPSQPVRGRGRRAAPQARARPHRPPCLERGSRRPPRRKRSAGARRALSGCLPWRRGSRRGARRRAATSGSGTRGALPASPACMSTRRRGVWPRSATSPRCRSFVAEDWHVLPARPSAFSCSRTASRRSRST